MQERQARSWLLSVRLCIYLVLILNEYLVPVKCQVFDIRWVQIAEPFSTRAEQLGSHSFHKQFCAGLGLAPCSTLELALYWHQDAN